jgi:pyridoxamine 5'-phosphate oxidase
MSFQDCIDFANDIHTCFVATADGDQPRVRAIGLWFADEKGFYFQTETVKAFNKQLMKNKKVEFCFMKDMKVLRVSGEVEFLTDLSLKERILRERAFLKGLGIDKPDNPLLVVFRVYKGEAYFWTMADNMKESNIERIKFGSK